MLQSDRSPDEIWKWLENIKQQYMPNSFSHRHCTKEYTYYVADPKRLPQHGTVLVCDVCMKSVYIFGIYRVFQKNRTEFSAL